jgi:hypothetical protein
MSFMSNHVIHVESIHSCQIMSFMSNHVIHLKSCHLCQIMSFMSNQFIHVKSCRSCQIMSFLSNHISHLLFGPFPDKHSVKSGLREEGRRGGVKYVFLSLRRHAASLSGRSQKGNFTGKKKKKKNWKKIGIS